MGTVTLLFGIHNHQPQGNFDHVFAQGYADCYLRLLDAIERHPTIRVSLHHSGPLIEWIEANHRGYFDRLARLVSTDQVEALGGGFYEPMLSVLPEADAAGQLEMMADFLEDRVGKRPRGMWLAERVWEPDLARVIAEAGYEYTLLDDGHFLGAGMQRPLRGYYVTDKGGWPLALFPIAIELRYAIPFHPAEEAIAQLLTIADEAGDGNVVVTYGDDGEKFGMWPQTKEWVWDQGWLEQFLGGLEKHAETIRTATFSDMLDREPSRGRVYLPTASYDEMGEWSLPADAQPRLHALTRHVEAQGKKDSWGPFVRGGIWQGFLAKYPEANMMHKRMCATSARVAEAGHRFTDDPRVAEARRELYRGQCNCAYWHGLFGGLYLAKLRSAVHTHLIRADRIASELLDGGTETLDVADVDADRREEVLIRRGGIGLTLAPHRGGAALNIDDRHCAFCITDVLTRREEAYHQKIRQLAADGARSDDGDAPKSIHEISTLKDTGLADVLVYDAHQRLAFIEQIVDGRAKLDSLWRGEVTPELDLAEADYALLNADAAEGLVQLGHSALIAPEEGGKAISLSLRKTYRVGERSMTVALELLPDRDLKGRHFATEISVALPCGPHPDGVLRLSGDQQTRAAVIDRGIKAEIKTIELIDPHHPLTIELSLRPAARVVHFPLETASQSESGFERTYQGTTLSLLWPCELDACDPLEVSVELTLRDHPRQEK